MAAVERRRTGGDALDAGLAGSRDAHQRRRDHRVAAAGNVRADRADRHMAVTEPDARNRLDIEVDERGTLRAGERADLLGGELEVRERLDRNGVDTRGDGVLAQAQRLRRPAVEPQRVLAHGCVATRPDRGDDGRDRVGDRAHGSDRRTRPP
jgi:hypothetical protein